MSEKFTVTQCCCGCTLKTGSLIIGILCLIGSLIGTIQFSFGAVTYNHPALWYGAVVQIVMLIAAILLVHGARTEQASLVRVWVYIQSVITILQVINLVIVVITSFTIGNLISALLTIALCIYFIIVVRSYAIELENGGANSPA